MAMSAVDLDGTVLLAVLLTHWCGSACSESMAEQQRIFTSGEYYKDPKQQNP